MNSASGLSELEAAPEGRRKIGKGVRLQAQGTWRTATAVVTLGRDYGSAGRAQGKEHSAEVIAHRGDSVDRTHLINQSTSQPINY